MSDKAYITFAVLKWARESARISLETAAGKAGVSIQKIKEWEGGTSQPTIRQAEILAHLYKRPFALLFLPEPPMDFLPLQDFRRKNAKALGTASLFIIREMQQKHAWIREIYEENNEQPIPYVGRYSMQDNPIEVAGNILTELGIVPGNYPGNPIREWIEKCEAKGIFISRTSFIHSRLKLDSDELQGFAIADKYAPFIFVNSDDWNAPAFYPRT